MVALSDLTFLARGLAGGIKNVAGSTITVALATLARGLQNASTIDIDATGGSTSTVIVRNSTSGQVADLAVSGDIASNKDIAFASGTAFLGAFRHAITAARDWTFPNVSGDVLVRNSADGVVTITADTLFNVPDALADSSASFCNQETGQACNLIVDGTVQFKTDLSNGNSFRLTGTPTAPRTITFPDSDITIGASIYIGSDTKANLNALPPSATPITAFCTDIVGAGGGGVLGVQVYWCPAPTAAWLRYGTDTPI